MNELHMILLKMLDRLKHPQDSNELLRVFRGKIFYDFIIYF